MLKKLTTPILLTALLASLSGCEIPVGANLFCDVVQGPIRFEAATAAQVVSTDRAAAEAIDVQNIYGEKNCAGW